MAEKLEDVETWLTYTFYLAYNIYVMKHRNLIFLWSLCLTIIGVAAGVRINEQHPHNNPELAYSTAPELGDVALSIENTFYEDNATSSIKLNATLSTSSTTITVSAKSYLVGDVETGEVYLSKNRSDVLPVASMSKLITAFAVTDMLKATTTITITPDEFNVATDTSKLSAGEKFYVNELLYPLLMNSSNVAAEAFASSTDRKKFMEAMISYAWEVGMLHTFFDDPSGLSSYNVSSASDFFALAQYLFKSRPDILAITRIASTSIASTTNHAAHNFTNIHPFVNNGNFLGGKTGHTTLAKDTMLTIMNINNKPVAIIVIASENRKRDTQLLIDKYTKLR